MERINIAELLRNCPKGMKLDCAVWQNLYFKRITHSETFPISCYIEQDGAEIDLFFTKYGCYHDNDNAKCVIFPKGRTSWERFVPPVEFKDGDIISDSLVTCIFKGGGVIPGTIDYYCGVSQSGVFKIKEEEYPKSHFGCIKDFTLSTSEEKEKFFKTIEENGYRWNAEMKILEKLIKKKFKVGDKVRHKVHLKDIYEISEVREKSYALANSSWSILMANQDNYELLPDVFNFDTLKTFDKVLARFENDKWFPAEFGFYDRESRCFILVGGFAVSQCIPLEGNEHLLGSADDCDEFYKIWEV